MTEAERRAAEERGFQGFLKMKEIHLHLDKEAQWWVGEGMKPLSIATVFRALAEKLDPPAAPTWAEQWEVVRPR